MSVDLDDLRARVQRKRQQREKAALLMELRGQDAAVDAGAVYLSAKGVAAEMKVCKATVLDWIQTGKLKARKAGRRWAIHPEDLKIFEQTFYPRVAK